MIMNKSEDIMKLSFHNDINSLINSYQRTIDTFTDQIRYYSNYSIFKKLVDEAIKQGEELLDLLDCLLRDTETIKEVIMKCYKKITMTKDDMLDEMKVL